MCYLETLSRLRCEGGRTLGQPIVIAPGADDMTHAQAFLGDEDGAVEIRSGRRLLEYLLSVGWQYMLPDSVSTHPAASARPSNGRGGRADSISRGMSERNVSSGSLGFRTGPPDAADTRVGDNPIVGYVPTLVVCLQTANGPFAPELKHDLQLHVRRGPKAFCSSSNEFCARPRLPSCLTHTLNRCQTTSSREDPKFSLKTLSQS